MGNVPPKKWGTVEWPLILCHISFRDLAILHIFILIYFLKLILNFILYLNIGWEYCHNIFSLMDRTISYN